MRKLASIQKISSIETIQGADRIELAHVLGWQCVVNKGQFNAGDLAVYFEIDSFLPVREQFEFLRKNCFTKSDLLGEGFKLKTKKFKGVISQGLLLPVSDFPKIISPAFNDDVTELLGVRKWAVKERETESGTIIGTLPDTIPHTDEIRIQAMPELLGEFAGLDYYITTKLDGSSHSIGIDCNGFHVTGHNYEYSSGAFYDFVQQHGYADKLKAYAENKGLSSLVIQGEFCGQGIQGNKLKLNAPEWFIFTVIENGKRVSLDILRYICGLLGLKYVPLEEYGFDIITEYPNVDALLARAEGEYSCGGRKEGIVIRPFIPVFSDTLRDYLSFKVINNKFLLKEGE